MLHGTPTGLVAAAVVVLARILLQSGLRARPRRRPRDRDREQG